MCEFATLESPYSMPVALHGDLDLTDPEAQTRSRALNQFLAGVELKAFKIAQAALRHEDDALDAVQDAMLQLARAYAGRPPQEWKPLFYRILENRIRDMQRRRTVRGRVMAWLPVRGEDEGEEPDPIAQAPSPDPQPARRLELEQAMTALERSLEGGVSRIDGRTRSRLNQARHAALEAAAAPRRAWRWRSYTLMPAAGVAAALLVTLVLFNREPPVESPVLEGQHAVEDMDLLAD